MALLRGSSVIKRKQCNTTLASIIHMHKSTANNSSQQLCYTLVSNNTNDTETFDMKAPHERKLNTMHASYSPCLNAISHLNSFLHSYISLSSFAQDGHHLNYTADKDVQK